jgi:hypothetical protein
LRWENLPINLNDVESLDHIQERFAKELESLLANLNDKLLALRVTLQGSTLLHRSLRPERERILQECQATATGIARDSIWIEKIEINTSLPKENTLEDEAVNEEVLVAILNVLEQAKQDPTLVSSFSMNDVRSRLPRAARNPSTDAYLDPSPQLLEWAKERLVEVLSGEEPTK